MAKNNDNSQVNNKKQVNNGNQNHNKHRKQSGPRQTNRQSDSNNKKDKENSLSIKEEFELREKRLKLVYRVLYVAAALWATIILTITKEQIKEAAIPFYAFLLSATSVFIIRIIKYALAELKCMKIAERNSESLRNEAETSYGYIWSLFGLSLIVSGVLLFIHIMWTDIFNTNVLTIAFATCGTISLVFNIIDIVYGVRKVERSLLSRVICDIISSVISSITAYSICSIFLMVATNNA